MPPAPPTTTKRPPSSSSIISWLLITHIASSLIGPLRADDQSGESGGDLLGDFNAQGPGVSALEILRARGYLAEEHFVETPDGYILQLIRGTNPLINNGKRGLAHRAPILFIHGFLTEPNSFVINSLGTAPSDLSRSNANQLDIDELKKRASARVLPLLAMDFGHEVWFWARRGAPGSQRRRLEDGEVIGKKQVIRRSSASLGLGDTAHQTNLTNPLEIAQLTLDTFGSILRTRQQASEASKSSNWIDETLATLRTYFASLATLFGLQPTDAGVLFSFDSRFWNYSMDEQAQLDTPLVVDFILEHTNRSQLAAVGLSAGGQNLLMALAQHPQLAGKISRAIFWSQSLDLGHLDVSTFAAILEPLLQRFTGSFPPAFLSTKIQALIGLVCSNPLAKLTLCHAFSDSLFGYSNHMEQVKPEFAGAVFYPTSGHEWAQALQTPKRGGWMHKFDWGPSGNLVAYGQREPPVYEIEKIKLERMSFYAGPTDHLVSLQDIRTTLKSLSVPYKFHLINTTFNHGGYVLHEKAPQLAIIPSLIEIQQSDESAS